jgi:surface antigen
MAGRFQTGALLALVVVAGPAAARSTIDFDGDAGGGESRATRPYLQCVPYARRVTGVEIYGDAHTWWDQAEGRYARGHEPKVGAVMAFLPGGSSKLGHVAAVSKIVDSRTVLISHANWSRRGQIERNVRAIDVSENNDWSAVRVWYDPIKAMGGRHWALAGFIYNRKPGAEKTSKPQLLKVARTAAEKTELVTQLSAKGRGRGTAKAEPLPKRSDPIGDIIARGRR